VGSSTGEGGWIWGVDRRVLTGARRVKDAAIRQESLVVDSSSWIIRAIATRPFRSKSRIRYYPDDKIAKCGTGRDRKLCHVLPA
jgi:hypothetical protein